jgi:hypothetical protein
MHAFSERRARIGSHTKNCLRDGLLCLIQSPLPSCSNKKPGVSLKSFLPSLISQPITAMLMLPLATSQGWSLLYISSSPAQVHSLVSAKHCQ